MPIPNNRAYIRARGPDLCQRVLLTPPGLIPNLEVKDLSWSVEAKSDAALIEVQSASTYFRQAKE